MKTSTQYMRPAGILVDGLRDLIKATGITDGIMAEVGSYRGESATIFWESGRFKSIHCVDKWTGWASWTEKHFDMAMRPGWAKYKSTSADAAMRFTDGTFDLVYIDATHYYHAVHADIVQWLPKVKQGGWIAGHDYNPVMLNGRLRRYPGVRKAVDQFASNILIFPDSSWMFRRNT